MAKAVIKPKPNPMPDGPHPKGEHIMRIMYDNNEPPKNYIWGHPDGYFYIWDMYHWRPINIHDMPPKDDCSDKKCVCKSDFITYSDLNDKISDLKTDFLNYLLRVLNEKAKCQESVVEDWFNENIKADLEKLLAIDHALFLTKESLNGYATEEWVEAKKYLTEQALDPYATREWVKGQILDSKYDDSAIKSDINELKISANQHTEYNNKFSEISDTLTELYNLINETRNSIDDSLAEKLNAIETRVASLEAAEDKDTVYDDSELRDKISALEDAGYATETWIENNYYTKAETDTAIDDAYEPYDDTEVKEMINNINDKEIVIAASLNDLNSRVVTLEDIDYSQFLTEHQSLDDYYNKSEVDSKVAASGTFDSTQYYTKTEVDNAIDAIEIPTIPKNVSAFTNDAGYLTTHQPLTDYATMSYVNDKMDDVLGIDAEGIAEIKSILEDSDTTTGILTELSKKANTADLATVATSGTYSDLTGTPTIPSKTSELINDSGFVSDLSSYYTKSQVDDLLDEKAEVKDVTTAQYEALTPESDVIYNITDAGETE